MERVPVCIHTWIEPQGEQYLYPSEISADKILAINNALATCTYNPILLPYQVESVQTGNMPYTFEGQELWVYWSVSAGGMERYGRSFNTVKMALLPYKQSIDKEYEIFQRLQELSVSADISKLYLSIYIPEQSIAINTVEKDIVEKKDKKIWKRLLIFSGLFCIIIVLMSINQEQDVLSKENSRQSITKLRPDDAANIKKPDDAANMKKPDDNNTKEPDNTNIKPKAKFDISKLPEVTEKVTQNSIQENQFITFKTFVKEFPGIYDNEDFKDFFEMNSEESYNDPILKFLENISNSKDLIKNSSQKEILVSVYLSYLVYWLSVAEKNFFQKEKEFLKERDYLENAIKLDRQLSEEFGELSSEKIYFNKMRERIEKLKNLKDAMYKKIDSSCNQMLMQYKNLKSKLENFQNGIQLKDENPISLKEIESLYNSLSQHIDYVDIGYKDKKRLKEKLEEIDAWQKRGKTTLPFRVYLKIIKDDYQFKIDKKENQSFEILRRDFANLVLMKTEVTSIYEFSLSLKAEEKINSSIIQDQIVFEFPSSIKEITINLFSKNNDAKKRSIVIPRIELSIVKKIMIDTNPLFNGEKIELIVK
ncbi:MAG: hypothetical protein HUU50_04715 [Candidatus Brocadiae bacterium]|nr:hypothetical protein [Candidatus Brocadiia bacterium]